jgi:hypothetical protein
MCTHYIVSTCEGLKSGFQLNAGYLNYIEKPEVMFDFMCRHQGLLGRSIVPTPESVRKAWSSRWAMLETYEEETVYAAEGLSHRSGIIKMLVFFPQTL